MPLTPFQSATLRLLAAQRSPESYLAGGTVLNAGPDTPRYSKDLDLFHDLEASVAASAEADAATLYQQGYDVAWLVRQPMFQRADVSRAGNQLRIEWVFDSAFRFFPTEPDELSGWRLNQYDAATNKVLALMGRGEPRDYLDILHFHQHGLSLGALCWAAAGKDPGVNPFMILQESQRTTHFRPEQFSDLHLTIPIDVTGWKQIWQQASHEAEHLLEQLPPSEVGCFYLANLAEAWAKRRYPAHFLSKLTDADGELQETWHWLRSAASCHYVSDTQLTALTAGIGTVVGKLGSMIREYRSFCR